jgi:hypothetical protein
MSVLTESYGVLLSEAVPHSYDSLPVVAVAVAVFVLVLLL